MSLKLGNNDYINILKYYKINVPKSKRLVKQYAEKIMAKKLCKCIKKLDPENEAKSIGICTKTIFNSKGFTRGKFKCKDGEQISIFRKNNNKTVSKNNKLTKKKQTRKTIQTRKRK